jgi:hypothetical protein
MAAERDFPWFRGTYTSGRMPASRADEAIRELTAIGNELKKLPPSKAVWDMQLFDPRDDSRYRKICGEVKRLASYSLPVCREDGPVI